MTILRDWPLEFAQDQIGRLEGESSGRILSSAAGREDWAAALADARELARPVAAWGAFRLRGIAYGRIELEGGAVLGGGPLAEVASGSSELLIAVCTIGEALSLRVRELQGERRMLRGLLLDDLGSWAVDSVRQGFCRRMEEEASLAGLRVSTFLSPGESAWPLEDQRVIFSLLDAAAIGVSLSPSLLMSPRKSLSLVMGRGSAPLGHEGGDNCDFCAMKDRCSRRSGRAASTTTQARRQG
jgi:hypothetical protein